MAIRTYTGVLAFALMITALAVAATLVSVQINYDPLMRAVVQPNAIRAAVAITIPLAAFAGLNLLRATRLSDELARLVSRDKLTDVATRDFFFQRLGEMPDARGVSLMIDIDFFKRVNDTFGHMTGDKVIAHVARVLRDTVPGQDIVCRFGGEEFTVFLFDIDEDEALAIAESLRKAVHSQPVMDNGQQVTVSVSVGVSSRASARDIDEAIRQADAALYEAKAAGRNRTVAAKPEPETTGEPTMPAT